MYLYPLQFTPIFKEMIWGGSALKERLNKTVPSDKTGESWELSGVQGNVSVVCNGMYAGTPLNDLILRFPREILGEKNLTRTGTKFPLLVKFIDACDDLSIQVHPNDEQVKHLNSAGKTEMWYILHSKPDAALISGFSRKVSPQEYLACMQANKLETILQKHRVSQGDAFFIPAGRVHAIGKGILLLEIQQSSDITYRIFDYNRRDAQGNLRQLHVDAALQVMDYNVYPDYKTDYTAAVNTPVKIAGCPYFTVNLLKIDASVERKYAGDSFVIYVCTQGSVTVRYEQTLEYTVTMGNTILLPAAAARSVTIIPHGSAEIVETYV